MAHRACGVLFDDRDEAVRYAARFGRFRQSVKGRAASEKETRTMKTAGVVIDARKLDVFRKHLNGAGYKYTEHDGPGKDIITLRVSYEWAHELAVVVEKANKECSA